MSYISGVLNQLAGRRMYQTSKAVETAEYVILALIAVLVPLLLQHPQLLVGSAVNFVLIMAAINVKGWSKLISLIVLPSAAALLGTVLFGPFKVFLLYMLPFIWLGNAALIFTFKALYAEKKAGFAVTLPAAALLKAGVIFAFAMLLIKLTIIPPAAAAIFASGMGIVQLQTALLGGAAAFGADYLYKRFVSAEG